MRGEHHPAGPSQGGQAGCLVLVALLAAAGAALLLLPVLGAHLAFVVAGDGWPHTRGLGWATWHLWAHPGAPVADWPAPHGRPATVLVWAAAAVTIMVPTVALIVAALAVAAKTRGRFGDLQGLASRTQEQRAVTAGALLADAAQIRPVLAERTPAKHLRVEQMGTRIGGSVATGQDIYSRGDESAVVTGLTGSGKTMSVIIPDILDTVDGPLLASTTKIDIVRATWQHAADRGGLHVFDLAKLTGDVFPALQWTPIAGCEDSDTADGRVRELLPDRSAGRDPNAEFKAEGRRVAKGLLHAAALADMPMSQMLSWVYNPLDQRPEEIIRSAASRGDQLVADQLASVRRSPEKQREGAYLSVRSAFSDFTLKKVLSGIDCRPSQAFSVRRWLESGHGSVYLISHKVDMPGAEKVVSLFFGDVLTTGRLLAGGSAGGRLDPILKCWADEVTNASQLADWSTTLSDSRGWGISAKIAAQSRSLLRYAYGREGGDAIWTAAGSRIIVGGGEGGTDTKELADAFDDHDVATFSRASGGGVTVSSRRQANRTSAQIRNLDPGRAIMLRRQLSPVELDLTPWWDRADAARTRKAGSQYDQARADGRSLGVPAVATT